MPQMVSPFGQVTGVVLSPQIYATLRILPVVGAFVARVTGIVTVYLPEFAGSGVFFFKRSVMRVEPGYVHLVIVQSLVTSCPCGLVTVIAPVHERYSGKVSLMTTLLIATEFVFSN